jgi:catechol 2,3-dioxygenase-like lactoylglutathione lyase family enzyme
MAKTATRPKAASAAKGPALRTTGIDHVVLHVSDVARSKAFYMDVLGMTVRHDGSRHVFLHCGDQQLALFARDGKIGAGGDLNHLAFAVDRGNWKQIAEALRARGIEVSGRSDDEECVYFEDPDGHQLQIVPAD